MVVQRADLEYKPRSTRKLDLGFSSRQKPRYTDLVDLDSGIKIMVPPPKLKHWIYSNVTLPKVLPPNTLLVLCCVIITSHWLLE